MVLSLFAVTLGGCVEPEPPDVPLGFFPISSYGGDLGDTHSNMATLSATGGLAVYWSTAHNIVPDKTNMCVVDQWDRPCSNILLWDEETRENTVVSWSKKSGTFDSVSKEPAISADGSAVAFFSWAGNVAENRGDETFRELYVKTLADGQLRHVTVSLPGVETEWQDLCGGYCGVVSIDSIGRFVLFDSIRTDLVPDHRNEFQDVFLYEMEGRDLQQISVGLNGEETDGPSWQTLPQGISGDGRFVVFQSEAKNLIDWGDGGAPSGPQTYLFDRLSGEVSLAVKDRLGRAPSDGVKMSVISADGNAIAFSSSAPDIIEGGVPDRHVYVHYRQENVTLLVSDMAESGTSWWPSINRDGSRVAFISTAPGKGVADENGLIDVYLWERDSGEIRLISKNADGRSGDGLSTTPFLSADGRSISFRTVATDLVPGNEDKLGQILLWRDDGSPESGPS